VSKAWQKFKNSKIRQCLQNPDKNDKYSDKGQDILRVVILIIIALVIGFYLITTTVLISKDGASWIECAQKLSTNPIGIIKTRRPPGYPILIFVTHKIVTLFTNSTSVFTWIYAAQSITLLCRLLALIPLYLIGKLLVGSKNSFWAILILIMLPYPAKMVVDVVREWPYILFLAMGFLFLLWGAKHGKWWVFGFVGLCAGLGYWIRPESAQLIVYCFLWLMLGMFWSKRKIGRTKLLAAMALLIVGFAIPAVPYMKCTGRIIPPKVKRVMMAFSFSGLPDKTGTPKVNVVSSNHNNAGIVPPNVLKAFGEIFETVGENLMWFFMLTLVIGFYFRFRGDAKQEERFLITAFVLVNLTMMVLRYCYSQPVVSKRWSLPLITFTIFYIPVGLQVLGSWLENKFPMNKQKKTDNPKEKMVSSFLVLLAVGIGICLPKLIRPVRIEKQGYREVAKWLRENTAPTDIIAVSDKRIAFYAERKGVKYGKKVPKCAKYVVRIMENKYKELNLNNSAQQRYSEWVDKREKKKRIVIYSMI